MRPTPAPGLACEPSAMASPRRPASALIPAFIGSDLFRNEAFGKHHPLSISRHAGVLDLCAILGWLDDSCIHECAPAGEDVLTRFHDAGYVQALRTAVDAGVVEVRSRELFGIGTMENPLFAGLFDRAAATVGGSIMAAQLALQGQTAFHPAGGTHHGRPGRASGFCYFNDPVFAVLTLLDASLERVLYIDLDAHHGDGVQDAFTADERVYTLSIHESNRWPYSGPATDHGGGRSVNLPVPAGFNDSELVFLMDSVVMPRLQQIQPQALVITCGADALIGDPLSRMEISNGALWAAVENLLEACPGSVVLGGGGYNPWTVTRCWTGLWGRLTGQLIPGELPAAAQALLRGFECDLLDEDDIEPHWITQLQDAPNTGVVREPVRRLADQAVH